MSYVGPQGRFDKHRDFKQLFQGSEIGKRVFNEILRMGHIFGPGFSEDRSGRVDPYKMSFNEGARNLALEIQAFTINEPPPPGPDKVETGRKKLTGRKAQ